jgi:hypothetical protein
MRLSATRRVARPRTVDHFAGTEPERSPSSMETLAFSSSLSPESEAKDDALLQAIVGAQRSRPLD